jgi:hypothetical protein
MRRTIIAAEHLTFPSTFSSNPPRFVGRARLATSAVMSSVQELSLPYWLDDHAQAPGAGVIDAAPGAQTSRFA